MSKVLFVVPVGQDMGGIITSTEQYVAGFRDAGHTVTPICANFTKGDTPIGPAPRGKFAEDYVPGPGTGWLLHPTAGWRNENRVSIASPDGLARFKHLAKTHDVIVWASMYGFRNDATEGTTEWVAAIKAGKDRNVFMIHDDHLPERYSWAGALAKYAAAFVGVQPCSYDSLESVNAPRAMVYTPLAPLLKSIRSMDERSGYLSCQVWKTWKRADALVAASAHMPRKTVAFAGDGIQLRYIRSKDKCPPRYAGIWDAAMKKQSYLGVLSEAQRDHELRNTRFLVDLSLRHNSGQLNRIVQEAMAQGCVVIANPKFITGTGHDPIFTEGGEYVGISEECYEPKALAARLRGIHELYANNPGAYGDMQRRARKKLTLFDRAKLAQSLVDIGMGRSGGLRYEFRDKKADKQAEAEFIKVFGAKP